MVVLWGILCVHLLSRLGQLTPVVLALGVHCFLCLLFGGYLHSHLIDFVFDFLGGGRIEGQLMSNFLEFAVRRGVIGVVGFFVLLLLHSK